MQYANGDRPYPCTICGKRFNQKPHLIIHKRTHTGEKPYSCHICHKRFAQTSHLTVHKRVHTGEKPFFCNFCGMGFCRRPRLESHILQHMAKEGRHPSSQHDSVANQESLDAAAQLMQLKMKGGIIGGGGPYSQIEPESLESKDLHLRAVSGNKSSGVGEMVTSYDYTHKEMVVDVSGSGGEGKGLNSDLTELTKVQEQALINQALVMPAMSSKMLSPNSSSSLYLRQMGLMNSSHSAMPTTDGNPVLTMTGLVRNNNRVSLIDFTAHDILQHMLSRDDIKSCDFCCLVFRDPAMYYLHRSMHDKMDVRCCNLCGKLMKDKYDFTAHYLNQHK